MNRSVHVLGLAVAVSALSVAFERDAAACGGCFHPPTQTTSDITDERMLLAVSPTQTTLYDQLRYSGNPTSFAWVLPIHGTVQIGLSADVLFDSMDVLTETTINPPPANCPPAPSGCSNGFGASAPAAGGANLAADAGATSVTVLAQENVGPYATVQLSATDSTALSNWLTQNGYNLTPDVLPVVNAYITEGFNFLAMKLLPNQGIQAMRPVRVTSPGASLSLPLRMAAVGTGATIGITIWVVSDGRYEPQNFPFFHIEDSQLVWDFSLSSSNYTTLRASNEAALGGKGWEIESSIDLNEQLVTSVILSGGQYYGAGSGFGGGSYPVVDPSQNYLPVGGDDGGVEDGGAEDGGVTETAEQVRTDDVNALFAGMTGPTVRTTRIRSDISHAAMTTDFVLQASSDQSELSNVRNVTASINLQCPIYNNCTIIGTGSPEEAAPSTSTSSVGATEGAGSNGCVTASAPAKGPGTKLGILGVMLGLVMFRVARGGKRASRKG